MNYDNLINERTYRVVLLNRYIPTLIKSKNVIISCDHFDQMRDYFRQEGMHCLGLTPLDAGDYLRKFIVRVVGCEVSIDYFKPTSGEDIPGTKRCYIIRALGETNKEFVDNKNVYLINIRLFNKEGKLRKREEIIATYNGMVKELKEATHLSGLDLVGLNENNYLLINTEADTKVIGLQLIDLMIDKMRNTGKNKNIICFNEKIKMNKNTGEWDPYIWVKACQNNGTIY